MTNRILVYILLLCLLAMLAGWIEGAQLVKSAGWLDAAQNLFFLTGLYLLVKNGTFLHTREFRLAGLAIAAFLVGSMLKIMHWLGANQLMGGGMAFLLILYLLHFVRKPRKRLTDIGKVIFVALILAGKYFTVMHWRYGRELTFLSTVTFILLVIQFIWENKLVKE